MSEKIGESAKQKLIGIEIGRNLNFDDYASSLCRRSKIKLAVIARLSKFMSLKRKWILKNNLLNLSLDIVRSSGCSIAEK